LLNTLSEKMMKTAKLPGCKTTTPTHPRLTRHRIVKTKERQARKVIFHNYSQDDCKVEFGAQRWEFYVLGFGGDSLPIANQFKNT